jgi:class 3 adenylate cyclase
VSQRVVTAAEDLVEAEALDPIVLKGFSRPVPAWSLGRLRA